jgi:anhydro-N-acetylmuramic acid kinase
MPDRFVGLMSGTSLDGVDAVLAAVRGGRMRLLGNRHLPFPARLRTRLLDLQASGNDELRRAALVANELSDLYSVAIRRLLASAGVAARTIAAIGCHGQTVRHCPAEGYTLQLVNGARLAERTGITVVCDFRSRDVAAGGEGAPLVPAFHREMFGTPRRVRAVVNVGGIANLTSLRAGGTVTGFDCGPGNCLLDAWIHKNRRKPYDRDGRWAASGQVVPRLLAKLLAHPYFRRPPPKSTGREAFNLRWVERTRSGSEKPEDVQATLLELTAVTIARAVRSHAGGAREAFVCGGGARNRALLSRLAHHLPGMRISTTSALGIAPEHVEALAFAWLARQALLRRAGNLPSVTGARGPRVLGAIYAA